MKNTAYESWKNEFEARNQKSRRNSLLALFLALAFIAIGSYLIYLWQKDELKFIGHETHITTANVVATKWIPVLGGFKQLITYEFDYNDQEYEGSFRADQLTGKHDLKDKIRVKFAIENPEISKRISTIKKEN